MCAEFACDAVKIAVGRFIPFQTARFIFVRLFQRTIPAALEYLKSFLHDQRTVALAFAFFKREQTVFHFFRCRFAGEAQTHRFAEIFAVVGDKVERNFTSAQNVLRRVRGIAAFQDHGVILFPRDIVGETKRICAEIGFSVFVRRADKRGRHGKEGRGLVKIVYDP